MGSKSIPTLIITTLVVIIGSIFLGIAAGKQDFTSTGVFVVALVALAAFAGLNKNIWIIIPAFTLWSGSITFLPIPFSLANIMVGFAVFTVFILYSTRRISLSFKFDSFDIFILFLLIILVLGYVRNPVGFASLTGGSKVGGRPYAEFIIAMLGYILLSSLDVRKDFTEKLPLLIIITSSVLLVGGAVAFFLPTTGIYLFQIYSGFSPNAKELIDPYGVSESIGRAGFVRPFAFSVVAFALAAKSPLKVVFSLSFFHSLCFYIGTIGALLSGYRGSIIQVGVMFIFSCWLWLRGIGLIGCAIITLLAISSAIFVQEIYPLPERLQRPLAMLPGSWDDKVLMDTENSTEWRIGMWTQVVEGDVVKNWWIGDGFGFPRAEFEYYSKLNKLGMLTPEMLAEYYVLTGGLHSGPLSSLKYVGWLGFIIFISLSTLLAVKYYKLWKMMRKKMGVSDKLTITVGFFALFSVYFPIKFAFIYGQFDKDAAALLISLGIYKMLEKLCLKSTDKP